MTSKNKAELSSIKSELQSIIYELESISNGVARDFSGIGSEQCSACLNTVLERYRRLKRKLDYLDTETLTESFKNTSGGGISRW